MSANRTIRALAAGACVVALLVGCDAAPTLATIDTLASDPNPIRTDDPLNTPQPHRDRPRGVCARADRIFVTMPGTEDSPGDTVAVVDPATRGLVDRVAVPGAPWACALDPSGRYVVVTLRYSDHALVLDAESLAEVARVPVPYYTESVLFAPDGRRVYFTNRWKDSVLAWDVELDGGFEVVATNYEDTPLYDAMGTPVGDNPSPDW